MSSAAAFRFNSVAEVDEWLDRERLPCPECGDSFENLGYHLSRRHGIDAQAFREAHGMPHNRGLVGVNLKQRMADRQRVVLARNPVHRERFVNAETGAPYSRHRPSAAQVNDLRSRIVTLHGENYRQGPTAGVRMILAKDDEGKLKLWACRGAGKGCKRNSHRQMKKPCEDCLLTREDETISQMVERIERGDG